MTFIVRPTKLVDCELHGGDSGAELFLVEGDSASKTVARVRDSRFQAVLPMQGKPMNAAKASVKSIEKNQLFTKLVEALGTGWGDAFDLTAMRYQRVILLFDPDADGIHCGALMLIFFDRMLRPLIDANRLAVVQPPLFEISARGYSDTLHAYTDEHYHKLRDALDAKGIAYSKRRYRGLASMNDETLHETCLDPDSRSIHLLQRQDAAAALAAFGGKR
ncbi:toprim domain-containing protein [Stieleria varia]|uniref:DNA topoisomerase (ATP-hydrolyzing) n=1 Tax=Stieleria varia TaxID=2528005 RepID=A0A5C6AVA0_9BACT|nr:toprim domain-containing protein [Stieleria varia]TWU02972.1 DNA gyrase subunit B [Stieleria varia]